MTTDLIHHYKTIRRNLPTLPAWCALFLARDAVKTAARIADTPKRKRARVATLRSTMRWEAKGGR